MERKTLKKILLVGAIAAASFITCSCGPAPSPPFHAPRSTPTPAPTPVPVERPYIRKVITSQLPAEEPYRNNVVAKTLEAMPAPCYLIDVSGSMDYLVPDGSVKKIDVVRKFKFPENAIVYAFSEEMLEGEEIGFDLIVPNGGTPLYSSIIKMLSRENCTDITALTDGESNAGPATLEEAIAFAKDARTVLNAGAIGDFAEDRAQYQQSLGTLAWQTGGTLTVNGKKVEKPKE